MRLIRLEFQVFTFAFIDKYSLTFLYPAGWNNSVVVELLKAEYKRRCLLRPLLWDSTIELPLENVYTRLKIVSRRKLATQMEAKAKANMFHVIAPEKGADVLTLAQGSPDLRVDVNNEFNVLDFFKAPDQVEDVMRLVEGQKPDLVSGNDEVNVTEIFKTLEKGKDVMALVEGSPGIGKTTFCLKLAYDCTHGKIPTECSFPKFEVVLLLKCRDIDGNIMYTIREQLLPRDIEEKIVEKLLHFLKDIHNQERILIILDGLDELPEKSRHHVDELLHRRIFPFCYVLATTRQERGIEARKTFVFDIHLEIKGYTESDSIAYVRRHFETIGQSPKGETDGLPAEFYKVFWEDVEGYLLNALNGAYEKRCLSISQRRGLITLLPKKNKPANLLKNWRPITLLNCDYKIAAKSIANRMKKFLPNIINDDQTGFLKNRFIGENIRLIESIINHTNMEQIPGLLLFVDFEKAFDSIEWSFIEKTLRHFNFGTSLVSWVKLFYTNISSCVLNNGWASDFFSLHRGVRQGCPLSPYLFILGAEILGNAVRRDTEIRGIKLGNSDCKLSQYADDTTMILDGSERSFSRTLYVLDIFANVSGLKANYEKTEALWIGSHQNTNAVFPSSKPIFWAEGKVYALGVWFSTSKPANIDNNFTEKIEKIKKILGSWSARRLTLMGKIAILKALAVSQIVYVLSSLPTPKGVIKEINALLYDFLWDNKGDKIKRTEMINDYSKGGAKDDRYC